MFTACNGVAPVPYKDPWLTPVDDRIKALSVGQFRVCYFYENLDNSTFRYRVYNMIQALSLRSGQVAASFFTAAEIQYMEQFIDRADVLVVCRVKYTADANRAITRAKRRGLRVLFDVDDLVFEVSYAHLLMESLAVDMTSEPQYTYWYSYIGRIGALAKLCDGGITTNAFLAKYLSELLGEHAPVGVIPNFMNREQTTFSDSLYRKKKESGFKRDDKIHLGYFSGTPSHNRDFQIISETLAELFDRDPRLRLRLVGYIDLDATMDRHADRLERYPMHDFINLQYLIGSTEINLVPLQNNIFTNCKSELKYFEAARVGTITVASPTFTYSRAITHGRNGFLANAQDWSAQIEAICGALDRYDAVAESAHIHAFECFDWSRQADVILSVLSGKQSETTAGDAPIPRHDLGVLHQRVGSPS